MNQEQLTSEFVVYVRDICSQPPEAQGNRLETVMARFANSSVRLAASSLLSLDVELEKLSDAELADKMRRHVTFRDGVRLPNGAWSMMVEAANRLERKQQPIELSSYRGND